MSRDHERYGFQFKLFELFGEIDKEFTLLHEENVMLRNKLGLPTRELPKPTKSLKGRVGRLVSSITTSANSQWYVSGQITAHQDINWSLQSHPELPTVFVSGSSDKTSRVVDRLNKQCYLYSGHKGTVNNVRFHPNWKVFYCCSSSGDRTCHIWPYQLSSFNNSGNYQSQKNLYSIQTNHKKTPKKLYQKEKRNSTKKSKDHERQTPNVKTKNIQPITPQATSKKSEKFDYNFNFRALSKSSSLNKLDYLPNKGKKKKNLHFQKNNLKQSKHLQNENLLGNSLEISRRYQKQNSEFETKIEYNNTRFKPHVPNLQKSQSNDHNSPVYERIERIKSIWPSDLLTEDEDANFPNEKNLNKFEKSNQTNSFFNNQRRFQRTNLTNENKKSQRPNKTANNKINEKNKNKKDKNKNKNKNKSKSKSKKKTKKKIEKDKLLKTNSEKENGKNKKEMEKVKEKEKNKSPMKKKNNNKVNNNFKGTNSEQTPMFDKKKNSKHQQPLNKIKSEKRKINKNSQNNRNASSRKYSFPPSNLEVDQDDLISSFNKNKINKFSTNKHNNKNIDYDDENDNDDDYSTEVDTSDDDDDDDYDDDSDDDNTSGESKSNEEDDENVQTNKNNHLNIDQESIISTQTSPLSKSINPNILPYNKPRIAQENSSDFSIKRGHQPAVILKGHTSIVSYADWVTTHSMINVVTGSDDNTVKLWNIETSSNGKLLSTLTAHDNAITHVSTHSSEPLILSSSLDSTFRLWDLRSSKNNVRLFKAHSAAVRSAIFSKNSNIIVSASDDRTGKIWDIRNSNHPLHSFNCSSGINKISISPRYGKIIAPLDNSTARIYDQNGKLISQLKSKEFGHQKMLTAADWTCDEKNILTTGIDHKIIVWSPPLKKKY
ncbi:wd repeat-containing protein [Anaeramoeba flamelloides]|uniref:Wd repeat-containing protein n=1 Tax=Anaeramoeba flamelloides TaxID=1746091 RepID=A0ABQ8YGR9_9EUKA|nr:wd repeat-containing protein [Anaeramoeba flamelloides]